MADGATYGDFQFAIDDKSSDFLNMGILSTYAPVEQSSELSDYCDIASNRLLSTADWQELIYLAHVDKTAAFEKYTSHYMSTNGQLYSSDVFQLATYIDDYHKELNIRLGIGSCGTEMITELYVPRCSVGPFLNDAAHLLRDKRGNVIYGTLRLIEEDNETFLRWAKRPWACIVLNLHVENSSDEIARNAEIFQDLIGLAVLYGGSYYLTYHKFATREQLLACYPEMPRFLELKRRYDPATRFRSDWFDSIQRLQRLEN